MNFESWDVLAANGGSLIDPITRIPGNRVNQAKTKEQKMRIQTVGVMAVAALLVGGACMLNAKDKIAARQQWQIKTSSGQIPVGWEPFAYDYNDKFDPFLLRRCTTDKVAGKQKWEVKTSNGRIPVGWEPFAYDSNDEIDPFLLRRCTTDKVAGKQKWEVKTSNGQIPVGWEPFAYDSEDEFDPFLLRRRTTDKSSSTTGKSSRTTNKWDSKQKWEVKTSNGQIPEGWEPFAYDSNDEIDPFLLRRCTTGKWDRKQQWQIKTSTGKIPAGWEPFAYDSNDEFDPFLLRRRSK